MIIYTFNINKFNILQYILYIFINLDIKIKTINWKITFELNNTNINDFKILKYFKRLYLVFLKILLILTIY